MDNNKNEFVSYLNNLLTRFDITLSEKQENQFFDYYNMLVETNKVMNLTSITEPKEVALKHFADSVSLLHYFVFYLFALISFVLNF